MPLSDHEQRLLEQIERALYAEDPKFASAVRSTDLRTHHRRRIMRSAVLFALGLVALVAGVVLQGSYLLPVAISGFALMVGAALLAILSVKRLRDVLRPHPIREVRRRVPFMERIEERWRRRWEERGR